MNKKVIFFIITSIIVIIIYLLLDYFNTFGFITTRLNTEVLGILINALTVILIFIITYSLVDKSTIEREEKEKNNKICTLNVMLTDVCNGCKSIIKVLDDKEMVGRFLIPKVDFKNPEDRVIENLKNNPFKNEKYIIELFSNGVVDGNIIKNYFDLKRIYQEYIFMKITFFDVNGKKGLKEKSIFESLEEDKNSIINNIKGLENYINEGSIND